MKKVPIISVVIPCLNEAGVVDKLLDQLTAQSCDELEIIAVDNSSDDKTVEILEAYKPSIKVAKKVPRGVSRARNAGAALAVGEWLLFLDADNQVPDNFVHDLLLVLEQKPEVTLAAVAYRAKTKNLWFKFLTYFSQFYQRLSSKLGKHPIVPGAFTLVKRELHEAVGGYDESIKYNEDFDYSFRINQQHKGYVAIKRPYVFLSTRRMERGGWRKMAAVYVKAERARRRGQKYDPEEYDLSSHKMR